MTLSIEENVSLAETYYEAFNSRDFDRGATLVSENVELVNVPLDLTFHGRAGYQQFFQNWTTAFPDVQVEIDHMLVGEAGVVTEFFGRGTNSGPLIDATGEIPPTGRQINVPFCETLRIKDGKIISIRTSYDAATLMDQLGLGLDEKRYK